MLTYYLDLALRGIRRSKALSSLIVAALAIGVGACVTTYAVLHALSSDPIPAKSDVLYRVQLDPGREADFTPGEEPPKSLTRYDAQALLEGERAGRQAMMSGGSAIIANESGGADPYRARLRLTSADFFPMFSTPLQFGDVWTGKEDARAEQVLVLSASANERLFGGRDSVGEVVLVDDHPFEVIGVMAPWMPMPRFYDLGTGRFSNHEDAFLPFASAMALGLEPDGSVTCHGGEAPSDVHALNAPCTWVQYWVELRAQEVVAYESYLAAYAEQQLATGRFERPPNARLRDVMSWLDYRQLVPADVRLQVWLAFAFLLVCIVNTTGLLLAKYLARGGEIALRRAIGATRGAIFRQHLVESLVMGIAGGTIGLLIAWGGLWAVKAQSVAYAQLLQLDPLLLLLTFALAVMSSVTAGLVPSWHACAVVPAARLKSH